MREVCSLQIDRCTGCGSRCNGAYEAAVFLETKDTGDSEVIVQLFKVHGAIKCSVYSKWGQWRLKVMRGADFHIERDLREQHQHGCSSVYR